jgi:triosephosphate isomerase (TIM)
MNLTVNEASLFVHRLDDLVGKRRGVEIVLAPTMLAVQPLHLQVQHHHFNLAAQNFYWRDHGAYTGEVSASQLRGLVQYGLVGHSERRHVFGERSKDIRSKVQAAVRNGITPVLCIGETASERADGETADAIHDQLIGGLANITSVEVEHIVVAYEPVWAIGTGKFAAPRDVSRAVKLIRKQIKQLFGALAAKHVRVLYGGSVNVDNASAYLQIDGVDGLLIGDTSLDVRAFAEIIKKADVIDKAVARKVA